MNVLTVCISLKAFCCYLPLNDIVTHSHPDKYLAHLMSSSYFTKKSETENYFCQHQTLKKFRIMCVRSEKSLTIK